MPLSVFGPRIVVASVLYCPAVATIYEKSRRSV
jgi:hypothetical protein